MHAFLLQHFLEQSAESCPEAVAVSAVEGEVTYAELANAAEAMAGQLVAAGIEKGDRVGIYLAKGRDAPVAIWGTLIAGGVCVPLSVQSPDAYISRIMDDCGVKVVITGGDRRAPGGQPVVPVADVEASPHPRLARPRLIDRDLAFVVYTSGSTGRPKGVKLAHRSQVECVKHVQDVFQLGPGDCLATQAPLHTQAFTVCLGIAAATGGRVAMVPEEVVKFPSEIVRFLRERRVTLWWGVGSVTTAIATRVDLTGDELPDLRFLSSFGEPVPTEHIRRLHERLPHVAFLNTYGSSECAAGTYYDVSAHLDDVDDIGKIGGALGNWDMFAVTDAGHLAEPGEVGEIYLRGSTLMDGYWGDPESTQRALVPNPLTRDPDDLTFRTGDLAIPDGRGAYRYVGRRDTQVKSRGTRIAVEEVEAVLGAHPDVYECAILARPDETMTSRLHARVVARQPVSPVVLSRWCASRLPRQMVPHTFSFCDTLPRTSTGKIDRVLLQAEQDHT